MNDPFNDPRFPDRPSHPDFWRLVEAINYLDGEAMESGRPVEEIVGEYIDMESLAYMARQRIIRLPGLFQDFHADQLPSLMALYLDAFTLGYRTAKEEK